MEVEKIMQALEQKHPGELEYLQAVKEVLISVKDVYNQHPEFERAKIIERIVEPERVVTFRVPWLDDRGEVHVNLGYRVQFNSAIGPYKGGLPPVGQPLNIEVPRFRADIQERAHHAAHGRRQGRFRLLHPRAVGQ